MSTLESQPMMGTPQNKIGGQLTVDSISRNTVALQDSGGGGPPSFGHVKKESVGLCTEPVDYSWVNINVFSGPCIRNPDGTYAIPETNPEIKPKWYSKFWGGQSAPKHILRNGGLIELVIEIVSGVANSGEILALMGSSGAGKTTLMDLLMFRSSLKLKISGDRRVNGVSVGAKFLSTISGYIQQDDLFLGSLSVKEHLMFQALFRMDRTVSTNDRELRVLEVIYECGLQKCTNSRIGVPGIKKGISGGERRRLSFAAEMITDPVILFCDEPTSGLDYFTAQKIVLLLQKMARAGKTIICTIHQPSSDIFAIFDRLMLMADGRTAFQGSPSGALQFFAEQGLVCPSNHNPADFFLEHLSILSIGEEFVSQTDRRALIEAICNHYDQSVTAAEVQTKVEETNERKSLTIKILEKKLLEQDSKSRRYKASSWNQCKALLNRAWITNWRNIQVIRVRTLQLLFVAGIFCLIYYRQKLDINEIANINGALFLFIVHMTFSSVFGVINTFCDELPCFLRDQSNHLYRTTFYFIGKTVADTPIHFSFPLLFALIVYFSLGLFKEFDHFVLCAVILTLVVHVSCSFGYMISCGTGDVQTALTLTPPLTTPILIFGGVFVNINGVPKYLGWFQYISWIYYATEAALINQWEDNEEIKSCKDDFPDKCPASAQDILQPYNFIFEHKDRNIWCLCALAVGFRIMAYIALQIKVYVKTRTQ